MNCRRAISTKAACRARIARLSGAWWFAERLSHFGKNGNRDLGWTSGADGKSDRAADAGEIVIREAGLFQPREARRMCLLRSQRADIEAVRAQCRGEGGVIDLRVMRDRDQRASRSQWRGCEHFVRPSMGQGDIRKSLRRRERNSRIDHANAVTR